MLAKELTRPAHRVYRDVLRQARLFAHVWQDPVLFASMRTIAHDHAQDLQAALVQFHRFRSLGGDVAMTIDISRRFPNRTHKTEAAKVQGKKKKKVNEEEERNKRKAAAALVRLKNIQERSRMMLKNIAQTNVGWPHAVDRALHYCYARRGPLRYKLLKPFLPQHDPNTGRLKKQAKKRGGSSQDAENPLKPVLPRRQQSPLISRSLRTLVLSAAAHSSKTPGADQFDLPPKLAIAMGKNAGLFPSENEAVAALEGIERNLQAIGITRRREANARWRWLTFHIKRLQPPMELGGDGDGDPAPLTPTATSSGPIGAIEARISNRQPTIPKRLRAELEASSGQKAEQVLFGTDVSLSQPPTPPAPLPPYLVSARERAKELGRGDEKSIEAFAKLPPERRRQPWRDPRLLPREIPNYNLVKHGGWARSGPTDFERDHRARRRMWAQLLSSIPLPQYPVQRGGPAVESAGDGGGDGEPSEENPYQVRVECSEPDVALPAEADSELGTGSGEALRRDRRLPTLQARLPAFQLAPAREWRYWVEYGLGGADAHTESEAAVASSLNNAETDSKRPETKSDVETKAGRAPQVQRKLDSAAAATLGNSQWARAASAGPRRAKPDSEKWAKAHGDMESFFEDTIQPRR